MLPSMERESSDTRNVLLVPTRLPVMEGSARLSSVRVLVTNTAILRRSVCVMWVMPGLFLTKVELCLVVNLVQTVTGPTLDYPSLVIPSTARKVTMVTTEIVTVRKATLVLLCMQLE